MAFRFSLPPEVESLLGKLKDSSVRTVAPNKVRLGYLYFHVYSAKLKDKLPYWDALPLFFVLAKRPGNILGINIHYLPYQYREKLAEILMRSVKNKNRINYGDIKSAWKSARIPVGFAQLCIRSYLWSHIKSPIKEFDWSNYQEAVKNILPKFRKAQEDIIWLEIMGRFYSHMKQNKLTPTVRKSGKVKGAKK